MLEPLKRAWYAWEDRLFDLRAGIDTRGVINADSLETTSPYKNQATSYQAAWCRNIRRLLNEMRDQGHRPDSFVDVGCGLGKACFYASRWRFKHIVGVDFDATLVQGALLNRERCRLNVPIEFSVADAASYQVPDYLGSFIAFLFNPFGAEVLRLFLEHNQARMHNGLIAYANDKHREVLISAGMKPLFREDARAISLWKPS